MTSLAADQTAIPGPTRLRRRILRLFLMGLGGLFVAIGVLGIFLPLLPSIEFFLLAGVCFARSSPAASRWLMTNRLFGQRLSDYRSGRGATVGTKVSTFVALVLSMGATVLLLAPPTWVDALLVVIAVGVTAHLLMLKTVRRQR